MKDFTELVPITFVLGLYVALVVKRWWDQYLAIPSVDRVATQISAYVQVSAGCSISSDTPLLLVS